MPNSNTNYYSGIPMVSVDDAEEIAELCMLAKRPERIAEFLGGRLTPGEVRNRLAETAAPPTPAARGASSVASGSQHDALAAAVKKRLQAMYPPRSQ